MKYVLPPYPWNGQDAVLFFVLGQIQDCVSLLDVGCGPGIYTHRVSSWRPDIETSVIDGHLPSVNRVNADHKYQGTLPDDLLKIPHGADAVMCLDVVEHLEKPEALRLIEYINRKAQKVALIFTPLGFMPMDGTEENPLLQHRCGFEPEEFERLGWKTYVWPHFDYGNGVSHDALWALKRGPTSR